MTIDLIENTVNMWQLSTSVGNNSSFSFLPGLGSSTPPSSSASSAIVGTPSSTAAFVGLGSNVVNAFSSALAMGGAAVAGAVSGVFSDLKSITVLLPTGELLLTKEGVLLCHSYDSA